jgi:hypothetical protein
MLKKVVIFTITCLLHLYLSVLSECLLLVITIQQYWTCIGLQEEYVNDWDYPQILHDSNRYYMKSGSVLSHDIVRVSYECVE